MFDRVYDFFFGDQLRKYAVLISAFLFSQVLIIPLIGQLEPSQYVALAVTILFISIWPLAIFYDRFSPGREEHTDEPGPGQLRVSYQESMRPVIRQIEERLY
jgi:hypothetical protein